MSLSQSSVENFIKICDAAPSAAYQKTAAGAVAPAVMATRLPYSINALSPHISAAALELYCKFDTEDVAILNRLVEGTSYAGLSVDRVIKDTLGKHHVARMIFNHASHIWHHRFFLDSLNPRSGDAQRPTGHLLRLIERDFGHFSDMSKDSWGNWANPGLKEQFFDVANGFTGNGWAWLVMDKGKLEVLAVPCADLPFSTGIKPLCVIDLWEHAYQQDYPNRREKYLRRVLDNLLNWEFAAKNLRKSL